MFKVQKENAMYQKFFNTTISYHFGITYPLTEHPQMRKRTTKAHFFHH